MKLLQSRILVLQKVVSLLQLEMLIFFILKLLLGFESLLSLFWNLSLDTLVHIKPEFTVT